MNEFIKENTIGAGTSFTENGAVSYASAGSSLLDQFAKAGTARGRNIEDVWNEQATLWAEDPESALVFPFYLRLITRQVKLLGGEKSETVQRGQGARDESFKRFLWIAKYHPEEFYRNLWLIPIIGSWKDLWQLMVMDAELQLNAISRNKVFTIIAEGINDANHKDLVIKYLPRIRSNNKCKTPWAIHTNNLAKDFAKYVGWSYKDYREFKATGRAHKFQTIICKGLYNNIDWKTIPGKALLNLVTGDFLKRHGLENKYINWLKKQPVAKFNGYVYELGMKADRFNMPLATKITLDKQFDGLIETAKKDDGGIKGNVLCALDTSSSMNNSINGTSDLTSYDVCVSLGIYFSELNTGDFHNVVAMFDNTSELLTLKGTFTDKWNQIKHTRTAWGSTNFQSLIALIVETRKNNPNMALEDFPKTLIVVSDMQFNPTGYYGNYTKNQEFTNYELAMEKLRSVFPEEFVKDFKIIWWYCAGRDGSSHDVPATMDMGGQYLFSGFDGAVISLLLGGDYVDPETGKKVQPTMEEAVRNALSQEVLAMVR